MPQTDAKPKVVERIKRPLLAGAFAAAAMATPGVAGAATDIFLRLDGIPGESTDSKHMDQIEILSFSLGFSNTTAVVGGGGAGAGKPSCGDVVLTKIIDKSSTSLIGAVLTGQHIKSGTLAFTRAGANPVEYYIVTLTDLLVKAIQQSEAAGAQKLTEQVTVSAVKFKFDYRSQNPDGTLGPPKTFTFDCKQNKAG